ncbi:ABC transporter ATP-binding protein [Hazenella sp. IB182357]|uniref:ABC transporter ATP-binding protein n=1 Tax=Polycladospora coralii TaxID=2771432 RepID=A0A926N4V6_9BACL|nr:ABC transporter ATP-binding protein [Polycladospora coralii]MBD1371104.1 ABC transporter ATP-binding protein [Polycladospora coralii]MBS7530046.1 ABC transporter ATP-binding protein [Polycladospora coralii]
MKESSTVSVKSLLKIIDIKSIPWYMYVFIVSLSLISTVASLFVPWFTKNIVDVLTEQSFSWVPVLFVMCAFLIDAVAGAFSTYFLAFAGGKMVASLRKRLWEKILHLPVSYFDRHRTGETISRVSNDTAVIRELITNHVVSVFSGLISLVGAISILFYLDWQMTLVMLTSVPVIFLIMRPIGRKMYQISKNLQNETAKFTSSITQAVSEMRLVKAYVAEPVEKRNGGRGIQHLFEVGLKEARLVAILQPFMSFLVMFMLVVIIGYGGYRVSVGYLTAGDLVAFILYIFQIILPLTQLTQFFTSLQKSLGATERILQVLSHEEEDHTSERTAFTTSKSISFEHVHFSYTKGEPVLDDVSFEIKPGKVTAIVGPSGSGKTTLFSLLERFYAPTSGMIKYGKDEISSYALSSWRSHISYVSQESPLLAGTIRENICYAMPREVSDDEVQRAAQLAYVDEFVADLPEGYETETGERGMMLSGGQRQRIAIARAILHNPQILMLDEATSALDSTSEKKVQEALSNLMIGRTTLVIAHRLSTVIDADQIVVMEKGRITGIGNHQSLLAQHQLYQQLVDQQLKMELGTPIAQK